MRKINLIAYGYLVEANHLLENQFTNININV